MHPRTSIALKQLDDADWFSRVGVDDTEGFATLVSSWEEAIAYCASQETRALWLEAANQFRLRVLERSRERYRQWNEIAKEIRPIVDSFVGRKIGSAVSSNNLPKIFEDHVRWEIAHLFMECEYADVYPPGFFASHAYWYIHGHFPCGWKGSFPNDGKLVVF
jgi:hypothetical protein